LCMGCLQKKDNNMIKNRMKLDEMNLYVSTTFLKDGSTIEEALNLCQKHDIINLELGSNHCYSPAFASIVSSFDLNYLVHNYFPIPKESFVLNLASSDERVLEKSIKHVKTAIDFCAEVGALLYTFHPGFLTDPQGPNQTSQNYDFQWDDSIINKVNHNMAYERMLKGIDTCVEYARQRKVKIAIETEGSYKKRDHLLMQHPEEYTRLFKSFSPDELGINMNIGHLKLAAKAFDFTEIEFADLISDYIVAMELSHNDGMEDQHLPLIEEAWYWPIILDPRFSSSYKIMEFRDVSIQGIQDNIILYKKMFNDFQIS
jgi:sugar phosphate isomerase/epimerase